MHCLFFWSSVLSGPRRKYNVKDEMTGLTLQTLRNSVSMEFVGNVWKTLNLFFIKHFLASVPTFSPFSMLFHLCCLVRFGPVKGWKNPLVNIKNTIPMNLE